MSALQSVCIYCGSSATVDPYYRTLAYRVGTLLGTQKIRLIYGGGRSGLMGEVADGALHAGGTVIGIIPHHMQAREIEHRTLSELHVVDTMHTRKMMMAEKADGFVVLPGGLGTLEEVFEILTWKQLGLHNKPIVIFNAQEFWNPLLGLIRHIIAAQFAPANNEQLYEVIESLEQLMPALGHENTARFSPEDKWF
ncbi:MAG: TIGR00730 family Rossman fold protein [Alphaproteobacteria bacterium]|nr:TIGR00730 family Rossman fold protein [Alphaproteobacteria bacterium]